MQEIEPGSKVCAVVVTYNRKKLLERCILHLLAQKYPLDILVYDNHSNDGTEVYLKQKNLRNKIAYVYAGENSGGAGGFYYGIKEGMQRGNYDYFWLMDDDGYPLDRETLSNLMSKRTLIKNKECIVNSLVVCDGMHNLCFSLKGRSEYKEVAELASDTGMIIGDINPFNGTLISIELINKIGLPLKEFFVYGDESEYTLRAKRSGAEVATVLTSLYFHPKSLEEKIVRRGKDRVVNTSPIWKIYCSNRNMMYVTKQYYGFRAICNYIIHRNLEVFTYKDKKFKKFIKTNQGIIDGLRGKFDRKMDLTM